MKTNVPWMAVVVLLILLSGCRSGLFQSAAARQNQLTDSTLATYEQEQPQGRGSGETAPKPRSISENLNLGHAAAEQKRWREARSYYEAVLQADPAHPVAHHRLAVIADQSEPQPDFALAERHYLAALKQRPADSNLLNDLGYSYLLQGRFEQSEQYLKKALQADQSHQPAMRNLGLLYSKQGDYDRALAMFRQAGTEAEAQAIIASLFPQGPPEGSGGGRAADSNIEPFGARPLGGGLAQSTGGLDRSDNASPTMRELMEQMERARHESLATRGQGGRRPDLKLVPADDWPGREPDDDDWPQAADRPRITAGDSWADAGDPRDEEFDGLAGAPAVAPAGGLMTIEQMQAYEDSRQRASGGSSQHRESGVPQITPGNTAGAEKGRSAADPLDSMPTWPETAAEQAYASAEQAYASAEPRGGFETRDDGPGRQSPSHDAADFDRGVIPAGHQQPDSGRPHPGGLHADYQQFPAHPGRSDHADYQAFPGSSRNPQPAGGPQNLDAVARRAAVVGMGSLFPIIDQPAAGGRVSHASGVRPAADPRRGAMPAAPPRTQHPDSIAQFPVESPPGSGTQAAHRQPSGDYDHGQPAPASYHSSPNRYDQPPTYRGQEPYGVHQSYDVHRTASNRSPYDDGPPPRTQRPHEQSAAPSHQSSPGGTIPAADYSSLPGLGY